MVKVRMTTADVAAEVRCLRKLIGMRCGNIYDLSPKIYVLKLAKSSGVAESGESEKALVLLESGVRLHTTEFSRDKSTTPSGFTLKLRKHVRTRRLEDVRQLGIDRVVDFQFGLGETAHHVILELYAQGNILLTDSDYNVLTLLRSHRDDEKGITMMAHHRYPIHSCRLLEKTTTDKIHSILSGQNAGKVGKVSREEGAIDGARIGEKEAAADERTEIVGAILRQDNPAAGKKGSMGTNLKTLIGEALGYGPALSEHIILDAGLPPNMKVTFECKNDGRSMHFNEDQFKSLVDAVKKFEGWLESVIHGQLIPEGYIFMQKHNAAKLKSQVTALVYDEFSPLFLNQLAPREFIKVETFDSAMDEFFSKIEGQRAEQQKQAQEESAFTKLEKIRADQTNRVKALKKEVDQSVRMAELIEYNLDDVDAALSAVRVALASSMDWKDLARMIKEEKKAGNPVAGLIHSLHLETNQITLLLSNNLDDMDELEKTKPVDKVDVDLSLSAHANARRWFETKKKHSIKQDKTVAAHEKAFKAAERRTQQQLASAKTVAAISHLRKIHWFEKFNWFISSENYLVISGRDAQQNELVVKRYMKKGDLYVHADLHGACSTVIKNRESNSSIPIPPLTVNQAGSFTVCRSQAWDSKIVTSAWWVEAHQVSKTAPTGEYLTVGSFMVRGKKNFLPPNPLVMGFGFLFRLDESSIAGHLDERRVRGEGDREVEDNTPDYGSLAEVEEGSQVESMEKGTGRASSEDQSYNAEGSCTDYKDVQRVPGSISTFGVEGSLRKAGSEESTVTKELDGLSQLNALLDSAFELCSVPKPTVGKAKYGLDEKQTSKENEKSINYVGDKLLETKSSQRVKPYLSKAERRKLKKGNQIDDSTPPCETGEIVDRALDRTEEELDKKQVFPEVETAVVNGREKVPESGSGSKVGRGRKGKLKKIKEKYADQDEEERFLQMTLLASAGRPDSKGLRMDKESTKPAAKDEGSSIEPLEARVCYRCKMSGHLARDCPSSLGAIGALKKEQGAESENSAGAVTSDSQCISTITSSSTNHDGEEGTLKMIGTRVDGLSRRAHAKAEKLEIAALMAEENVRELGDAEREKLTELDSLTGDPSVDDVLLYAVPVCGPYNSLQGYKYRIKLTPGAAKKGKAAKMAVDVFGHMQEVSVREKELMKAVTDAELVACMIGNVKITAPGLTKMKQTQKKTKKSAAKTE